MCKMQEMGSPPEEVMGEMPEGLVSPYVRRGAEDGEADRVLGGLRP